MSPTEVSKLMQIIKAEYRKAFEITDERVLLWSGILKPLKYKEGLDAIISLLSESRPWPPQVGEVYQHALSTRRNLARKNSYVKLQKSEDIPEEIRKENIKLLQDLLVRLSHKVEGGSDDSK